MNISERQIGPSTVLDVTGPITGHKAADMIDAAVRRHARAGTRILVVNLGRVPRVDLAGLGALVDACIAMRQASGVFRLACVAKRIHDLVVITRLATVIDTFDSVEEAAGDAVPADDGIAQGARLPVIALAPIQRFLRRA
jgi:anti-sigma B factor antagonist